MSVTNRKICEKRIGSIIYSLFFFDDNKYVIYRSDEKKIKEDIDHIKNTEACFGYEVAVFNKKEDAIKYLENLTKKSNPSTSSGQEINPSTSLRTSWKIKLCLTLKEAELN